MFKVPYEEPNFVEPKREYSMYISQPTPTTERKSVAMEVISFTSELADRANSLVERVGGKLSSVMVKEYPVPSTADEIPDKEYPPLFDELQNHLYAIRDALCRIENYMSRTEL